MFGGNKVDHVQLSSLCSTFIDGDWIESKDQSESGIRLIQTGNVGCGEYKDKGDKAKYITEDTFNKLHCTEIYPGDILISRLPDPVGRACVLPEGLGKCVTAVDCTIIRFSEKILPNFFVAYTNTPEYLNQIKSTLAGTTRLRVSRGNLGKVKIPVPSIEQQRTFVSIAEKADKSKFSGLKSQFFEMFGDTHMRSDYSRQWKEVVKIINGKDYKSIQVEDGGYPVYGTGGEMARASDYLSPANSILLGRKGTIDKPLLIREKYWNVDTAFGVVPDEKVLHYVYFYWHCKTIDFNVLNKGTTLPSTTKVDLLNLWIKIPSMEEQTRFASIVEQADKSKFSGLKSQFIEMFERNKYPRLSLDAISKEWAKGQGFKKDDICEDGETQCIHYGELFTKYGPIINEVVSRTSVEKKKTSKKGDILFPASDVTPNGLARCSMLPFDDVILGGDIIILRPKENYNAAYLSYAINQQTSQLLTKVNGGVVKHMSAKGLKTVEIPIPPMDKQEEYIKIAEQADKSKFELKKSIEAIDKVIKSLINNI